MSYEKRHPLLNGKRILNFIFVNEKNKQSKKYEMLIKLKKEIEFAHTVEAK